MVENLIQSTSEYRTSTPYKNLSFPGNKSERYSAVRESVAGTYLFVRAYSSGMRNVM